MTSLATVPRYSSTSLLFFFGASRESVEIEMKKMGVLKITVVSTSGHLPPKHRQEFTESQSIYTFVFKVPH